jgi:hypothetical protein
LYSVFTISEKQKKIIFLYNPCRLKWTARHITAVVAHHRHHSFVVVGLISYLLHPPFSAAQLLILAVAASTNHEQIDLNEQDT